jgi:hypothetical protein
MPASFGPARYTITPPNAAAVRVTTPGGSPAVLTVPVAVDGTGAITFEVATAGTYKLSLTNAAGYGMTFDIILTGASTDAAQGDAVSAYIERRLTDIALGGAVGTEVNTPSTIVKRDANGRFKLSTPALSDEAATKGYVDAATASVTATGVADGAITDAKIATNAAIALSKTTDSTASTGRLAMTNAERTKLTGVATGATANDTDVNLKSRANHTGTQTADTITDGTTNKTYTATEKTKLAGVAAGATANDTDANLKNRANHTGTQTSASISDFAEAVQDVVGAFFISGSGTTVTYDDAANTVTITAAGGGATDPEAVRDAIGAALIGVGNISVTVNDVADTITISTTATVNSTDAALRDRSTHTGTQSADTVVDGTTNKAYTATEKTKLGGVATGATANSTDTALRDRSTHTGTQTADTITDGTTNKAYTATEKTKLAGVATGATANDTDVNLKNRANHTGTQTADTVTDGTTNKAYTATEKTKLAGVATGATANDTDANLKNRANHTGTQAQSTVTNLTTDLAAKADAAKVSALVIKNEVAGTWAARPAGYVSVTWRGSDPSPLDMVAGDIREIPVT